MKKIIKYMTALLIVSLVLSFSITAYADEITPPLTPEGNLTLEDDVIAEDDSEKQFITLKSKNGNYFYLVIDRSGDTDNVYFLNMVDESDLLALIENDDTALLKPTPTATPKPTTTLKPTVTPVPPTVTEPTTDENSITPVLSLIAVILVVAGGGVYYFIKVLKPKLAQKKNKFDESNFDEIEDEEENYHYLENVEEEHTTENQKESEE